MNDSTILEMKNIHKYFAGIHALNGVSFSVEKGSVHALVGENGAGKSTLMKVLIGLYKPDKGEIILQGEVVKFNSVKDTTNAGISMIFQEFNQIRTMTIMENIYLAREPLNKFGSVDFDKMYKDSQTLLKKLGINLDPRAVVGELTIANHQLVEIVKAISYDANIIIMDEPTSALSSNEIEYLMDMIQKLKNQGKAIIFISHKMEEIYSICDTVTVLRDGNLIYSGTLNKVTERELIEMMVDREINELFPKEEAEIGEVILEVKNLTSKGVIEDISFQLHRGEILGFSGLMGAGRTEVMEAIVGERKIDSGEIYYKNEKITNRIPKDAIARGIAMVPEDRKKNGVLLERNVRENINISSLHKCVKGGWIRKDLEDKYYLEYKEKIQIKTSSEEQLCKFLSGGNQQKVAVARVLNTDPDIIILDEPTRGIDVKTKSEIHRLISKLAKEGKAVLMVSSELPEILGMSDNIIVLSGGRLSGILTREEATPDKIMELAIKNVGNKEERHDGKNRGKA